MSRVLEAFTLLAGLASEPLALVGPDGRVAAGNDAFRARFGSDAVGKRADELATGELPQLRLGEYVMLGTAEAAQLRASEARFHQLVDAVTDYAIYMLDANGNILTWSQGAKRTKGYEADEILGKHFSIFYTPEDRAAGRPQKILETVRRSGRYEEESWRVRKDGSRFWADVVITALRDSHGEVVGFAKVTRDLTKRRAAEENERALVREQASRAVAERERNRLLALLEQVPATVNFLRGPDLVIEFAHPRLVAAFPGRELVGRPLLEAIPEYKGHAYALKARRVYETGEPISVSEVPIGGSFRDVVYLPVRGAEGAIDGVMTFEIDVTRAVRAREELERVNRAKDEFLATMSHELRTPLNAITGWAILLQRDRSNLERGLEVIERNARAQARIVSDLLDVSRIISGKLRLQLKRVDVAPLVRAAADVVRPAADAKGIRLVVDPDVGAMIGDPDRLQQIIWNLLTNAIRFTPHGGRVTLFADLVDSGVVLRVQDTGTGIAPEHLPFVFDRFRQIDSSTTRAHGGLGLGLAIVRHLVEGHGGRVEAASEGLGHGATFTVYLPVRAVDTTVTDEQRDQPAQTAPAAATVAPATDLAGVRVLAVDDDPDSLDLLRQVLEAAGAKVTTARSAAEALEARGPFDVILSDVAMPGMDGYALLSRLRDAQVATPAIALTAYARAEDAERASRAGFQAHLAKPVDHDRLMETIRTFAQPSPTAA